MSSGNSFADYCESQDYARHKADDSFQTWFDENEEDLREEYLEEVLGESEEWNETEFMAWAGNEWEKSR